VTAVIGFILSRHWQDTDSGVDLEYWLHTERGAVKLIFKGQEVVFFIPQDCISQLQPVLGLQRGWRVQPLQLISADNRPVAGVYFKSQKRARDAAQLLMRHMPVWESDIRPADRFLMERFIKSGIAVQAQFNSSDNFACLVNPKIASAENLNPKFRVVSLDIETDMQARKLFSIAVFTDLDKRVFMVGDRTPTTNGEEIAIEFCRDETQCLQTFFHWLTVNDPDVIIGWSVVGFDLWVLDRICQRLAIPFALGRAATTPSWRQDPNDSDKRYITIPGRVALDGIELLRMAFYHFESFSLEFVARALLGEGKLLKGAGRGEEISRLFKKDKISLAHYNLKDCELVWEIFAKTDLLAFASAKSQMTGLSLDRIGGSVAAFEFSYLPRLHRNGYVAPNIGEFINDFSSPGGYVLESKPGIFNQVLVYDFKSLYPSIVRSYNIDPCAFWRASHQNYADSETIPGFHGARFARDTKILPDMIAELWAQRDLAKREQNLPLSQAIKIIMNSFYGVLGSNLCRFFDPRIASSITLRGHEILQTTQAWFNEKGFQVIYGDTDSVFVWLGDDCTAAEASATGKQLARELNQYWCQQLAHKYRIESNLEIQFETHFSRFLCQKFAAWKPAAKNVMPGW